MKNQSIKKTACLEHNPDPQKEAKAGQLRRFPFSTKLIILAIVALALCIVPFILLLTGGHYGPVQQLLFSVLLFAASAWIGYSHNTNQVSFEATRKWLPFAGMAYRQLWSIFEAIARMRRIQKEMSDEIRGMANESKECKTHMQIMDMQCRESIEKLGIVENQVEAAADQWKMFIETNCEGHECEYFFTECNIKKRD